MSTAAQGCENTENRCAPLGPPDVRRSGPLLTRLDVELQFVTLAEICSLDVIHVHENVVVRVVCLDSDDE